MNPPRPLTGLFRSEQAGTSWMGSGWPPGFRGPKDSRHLPGRNLGDQEPPLFYAPGPSLLTPPVALPVALARPRGLERASRGPTHPQAKPQSLSWSPGGSARPEDLLPAAGLTSPISRPDAAALSPRTPRALRGVRPRPPRAGSAPACVHSAHLALPARLRPCHPCRPGATLGPPFQLPQSHVNTGIKATTHALVRTWVAAPPEVASPSQQTPSPPPHPGNCPRAAAATASSLQPLELGFSDGNLSLIFQGGALGPGHLSAGWGRADQDIWPWLPLWRSERSWVGEEGGSRAQATPPWLGQSW